MSVEFCSRLGNLAYVVTDSDLDCASVSCLLMLVLCPEVVGVVWVVVPIWVV